MICDNIINGDALEQLKLLPDNSVDCCVTSPPYWALRDYGVSGQLGLEETFQEYINKLCNIFDEVKRVLKKEATLFVNIGDTYSSKKSLCQIPSRFAIEMENRGWILRNEIIWHKPNCMPSSANDRFTVDFEKVFFFVKQKKYYFKQQLDKYTKPIDRWGGKCIKPNGVSVWDKGTGQESYRKRDMRPNSEGKNKRSVWSVNTKPFKGNHFATFPEKLIEPMISAGCPENGVVLDPFFGAGTTALVAIKQNKNYIGIELNKEYIKIAQDRINELNGMFI